MKIPGHCSVCGEPTHDIQSIHPPGHPFAGEPATTGNPIGTIVRAHLTLMDGSHTHLTVHEHCVKDIESFLPAIWNAINERTTAERKAHRALRQAPFTPEQCAFADEKQLQFIHNRPLGVYVVEEYPHG